MIIRPYEERDRENVRFVCLNSEGACTMDEKKQNFILTTYCDYFIEKEGENCFVACDENDRAIGYVLCAENYDKYKKVFFREYLPRIERKELGSRVSAGLSAFLQKIHKKKYPAHLHIDILPEYQRMGLGHKLMDALCEHLRKKGVKGVSLTVSYSNKKGRSFYEKYGFTLLEEIKPAAVYALKL